MFPTDLETERLRLRRPVLSDARLIFHAYTQDPEVTSYLVWRPHTGIETTKAFVADCDARWSNLRAFRSRLRSNGAMIQLE